MCKHVHVWVCMCMHLCYTCTYMYIGILMLSCVCPCVSMHVLYVCIHTCMYVCAWVNMTILHYYSHLMYEEENSISCPNYGGSQSISYSILVLEVLLDLEFKAMKTIWVTYGRGKGTGNLFHNEQVYIYKYDGVNSASGSIRLVSPGPPHISKSW